MKTYIYFSKCHCDLSSNYSVAINTKRNAICYESVGSKIFCYSFQSCVRNSLLSRKYYCLEMFLFINSLHLVERILAQKKKARNNRIATRFQRTEKSKKTVFILLG